MRVMMHPCQIVNFFKTTDGASKISINILRTMAREKTVFTVVTPTRHYLLDLMEVINLFSGSATKAAIKTVPRLRTYENTYHHIRKYFQEVRCTFRKLNGLINSGKVFYLYYGNRHLINYDQLKDVLLQEKIQESFSKKGSKRCKIAPVLHPSNSLENKS